MSVVAETNHGVNMMVKGNDRAWKLPVITMIIALIFITKAYNLMFMLLSKSLKWFEITEWK